MPGAEEDRRYPKVEPALHAQYHQEMFEWLRMGVLSNGEPLPDYLFSITPWIAGGWGADDWWGGVLGAKAETINAVQAIPDFVRRFSWDANLNRSPIRRRQHPSCRGPLAWTLMEIRWSRRRTPCPTQ